MEIIVEYEKYTYRDFSTILEISLPDRYFGAVVGDDYAGLLYYNGYSVFMIQ
ncbi:MAG: hypothetical protein PUG99_05065 [Firmicutes bacterium]|nr:hypothetical protein [Bacillota bacterium]